MFLMIFFAFFTTFVTMLFVDLANNVVVYYEKKTDIAIMILSVEMSNGSGIMSLNSPGGSTYGRALLCLAAVISPYSYIQRSVWRDIKFAVFCFLFVCTVEDISTQDGAIGVKFWLRVEQTPETGTR